MIDFIRLMSSDKTSELLLKKNTIFNELSKIQVEYDNKVNEYHELANCDLDKLKQDWRDLNSKIGSLTQKIKILVKACQITTTDKNNKKESLKKFQAKRKNLSDVLKNQKLSLQSLQKENQNLENLIQMQRQQNQECQEELHRLDIKIDNVRKYGFDEIPLCFVQVLKKKESLEEELQSIILQIKQDEEYASEMVPESQMMNLRKKIEQLQEKHLQMQSLQEENVKLKEQNLQLTKIKTDLEQNPNLEIKLLERTIQQLQSQYALVEREKNQVKKKCSQSLQKIQQFDKLFKKGGNEKQVDISPSKKNKQSAKKLKKSPKDGKKTLYDEIRLDLQKQQENKSWVDKLRTIIGEGVNIQEGQSAISKVQKCRTKDIKNTYWILLLIVMMILFFWVNFG